MHVSKTPKTTTSYRSMVKAIKLGYQKVIKLGYQKVIKLGYQHSLNIRTLLSLLCLSVRGNVKKQVMI